MEANKSNATPALSQRFHEAVMNVNSESRDHQQQVNSKSSSDTDCLRSRPDSQLSHDDNYHPSRHPYHSPGQVSSNSSGISASAESSTTSFESSTSSCESNFSTGAIVQPHQDSPVPSEYFQILVDDATDRYAEASNFFHGARSYSFMFEFYVKILNDLLEDLTNIPSTIEAYQSASTLCQRLRLLQQHLVWRRNKLLGYPRDQCGNEKISPPAAAEIYLEAAAEAKAARQRQFHMVVLIQTIADLKMKEDMCKRRRLEAEATLDRYLYLLRQSRDGDGRQKCDKFETNAPAGKENCENEDVKFANNHVQQDDNEFETTCTDHSRTRNGSSNDVSVEKKTSTNGDDMESFSAEQLRSNNDVIKSSSAGYNQNDSSNDPYCILWVESFEKENSSDPNQKMPLFVRLKPTLRTT